MARGARVESVEALLQLRGFLLRLAEGVRHGLGEADAEVRATERWLGEERPERLAEASRRAGRALQTATDDLRRKRFQPTPTGAPASVQVEQTQWSRAKAQLQQIEEQRVNTEKLARAFAREVTEYRGATQGTRELPESLIRGAVTRLDGHLRAIEGYLEAGKAGGGPGTDSIARGSGDAGPAPDATPGDEDGGGATP